MTLLLKTYTVPMTETWAELLSLFIVILKIQLGPGFPIEDPNIDGRYRDDVSFNVLLGTSANFSYSSSPFQEFYRISFDKKLPYDHTSPYLSCVPELSTCTIQNNRSRLVVPPQSPPYIILYNVTMGDAGGYITRLIKDNRKINSPLIEITTKMHVCEYGDFNTSVSVPNVPGATYTFSLDESPFQPTSEILVDPDQTYTWKVDLASSSPPANISFALHMDNTTRVMACPANTIECARDMMFNSQKEDECLVAIEVHFSAQNVPTVLANFKVKAKAPDTSGRVSWAMVGLAAILVLVILVLTPMVVRFRVKRKMQSDLDYEMIYKVSVDDLSNYLQSDKELLMSEYVYKLTIPVNTGPYGKDSLHFTVVFIKLAAALMNTCGGVIICDSSDGNTTPKNSLIDHFRRSMAIYISPMVSRPRVQHIGGSDVGTFRIEASTEFIHLPGPQSSAVDRKQDLYYWVNFDGRIYSTVTASRETEINTCNKCTLEIQPLLSGTESEFRLNTDIQQTREGELSHVELNLDTTNNEPQWYLQDDNTKTWTEKCVKENFLKWTRNSRMANHFDTHRTPAQNTTRIRLIPQYESNISGVSDMYIISGLLRNHKDESISKFEVNMETFYHMMVDSDGFLTLTPMSQSHANDQPNPHVVGRMIKLLLTDEFRKMGQLYDVVVHTNTCKRKGQFDGKSSHSNKRQCSAENIHQACKQIMLCNEVSIIDQHGVTCLLDLCREQVDVIQSHTNLVNLVQGPPGSGKSTIAIKLYKLLSEQYGASKVLYASPNRPFVNFCNAQGVQESVFVSTTDVLMEKIQNYDAIIADDAHYIESDTQTWKDVFERVANNNVKSKLYLFTDHLVGNYRTDPCQETNLSNCCIFHAFQGTPIMLRNMHRNCSEIYSFLCHNMSSDVESDTIKNLNILKGDDIIVFPVHNCMNVSNSNPVLNIVRGLLGYSVPHQRYTHHITYSPSDIAILFDGDNIDKVVKHFIRFFDRYLTEIQPQRVHVYPAKGTLVDSLDNFISMEARVCICVLCDTTDQHKTLMNPRYTQFIASRAAELVIFVVPEKSLTLEEIIMMKFDKLDSLIDRQILEDHSEVKPPVGEVRVLVSILKHTNDPQVIGNCLYKLSIGYEDENILSEFIKNDGILEIMKIQKQREVNKHSQWMWTWVILNGIAAHPVLRESLFTKEFIDGVREYIRDTDQLDTSHPCFLLTCLLSYGREEWIAKDIDFDTVVKEMEVAIDNMGTSILNKTVPR